MAGWIKIYRDLQDHWLAQDMEKLGRWVSLLWMATHEDRKTLVGNQVIEVKRGQIVASNSFLAGKWNCSERTVLRFLELLEGDGMLHRCTHRKVTIITICNYESYQGGGQGDCTDTCTDDAPMTHRSSTENKNEKNNNIYLDVLTTPAYTREKAPISAYAERYREEGLWADVAMPCKVKPQDAESIFEEFITEQIHNESVYNDYPEFKRHFLNYLRTKAERLRQSQKQESYGNTNRTSQRRGVQVVANSPDDYEGPF